MALFQSFLQGYQAGEEMKKTRQRSAALLGASQAYQAGDYDKAQQPLLEAGMLDEANFYAQAGDRKKKAELAKTTGPMLQNRDYSGAANAAFGAGDLDMGVKLQEMAANWTAQQKQEFSDSMQRLGSIAGSLFDVPQEQRGQAALAQIKGTPYESPQIVQAIEKAAADGLITDDELEAFQTQVMTAAEQIAGKRWQMQFDQNQRIADRNYNLAASKVRSEGNYSLSQLKGADSALMKTVQESGGRASALKGYADILRGSVGSTHPGAGLKFWDADAKTVMQLSSMMRGMMRPPGSGATSDYEQKLYGQGVPQVDNPPEVNLRIIENIEKLAEIADARRFFYEDYAMQNGTLGGAEQQFQASPEFRMLTGGQGGARGAGAAEGGASDPLGIR